MDDNTSIYTIGEEYIQDKRREEEFGTAKVGKDIRNRFIKDKGRKEN